MMRSIMAPAIVSLGVIAICGCALTPDVAAAINADKNTAHNARDVRTMQYLVMPHEDDEWELWSQVENRTDTYKVFIVMGRGEQTAFCDVPEVGLQQWLELAPEPYPTGRFTESCANARLNSWVGYFTQIGLTDPAIPSDFEHMGLTAPLPDPSNVVCRHDTLDNSDPCIHDTAADIWLDRGGRGALVAFNLGEGDQTAAEIAWAIRTTIDNRATLGLNTTLEDGSITGAYSNTYDPACFIYANPDHTALREALTTVDFGMAQQAAVCSGDVVAQVSESSMDAAFMIDADGRRVGAHVSHYGWLHQSFYPLARYGQSEIMAGVQQFEKFAG